MTTSTPARSACPRCLAEAPGRILTMPVRGWHHLCGPDRWRGAVIGGSSGGQTIEVAGLSSGHGDYTASVEVGGPGACQCPSCRWPSTQARRAELAELATAKAAMARRAELVRRIATVTAIVLAALAALAVLIWVPA